MKKSLIFILCMVILVACNSEEKTPILQCGGYDVQMNFSDGGEIMYANINGDDVELSHVVSASGAKYAGILNDTLVVLWESGDIWTLMLDEDIIIDCKAK